MRGLFGWAWFCDPAWTKEFRVIIEGKVLVWHPPARYAEHRQRHERLAREVCGVQGRDYAGIVGRDRGIFPRRHEDMGRRRLAGRGQLFQQRVAEDEQLRIAPKRAASDEETAPVARDQRVPQRWRRV